MAYLYDEASAAERALFEGHLDECPGCRDELQSFQRVRRDLGAWQVAFAPRVEIAPRRGKLEVMRELLGLLPVWARVGAVGVSAAAVLIVALAVAGARVSLSRSGFDLSFRELAQAPAAEEGSAGRLTRAETEALIEAAVARARDEAQQEARAQLASLEARLSAEHEGRMKAVRAQLKAEQRAVLARVGQSQPTTREWLFAANEGREYFGTEDGKNN